MRRFAANHAPVALVNAQAEWHDCHVEQPNRAPRIVTAKPPSRRGSFGWPRIIRTVVGRDPEPLTAMELQQAAERVQKGRGGERRR
jgi:hypothetical protein